MTGKNQSPTTFKRRRDQNGATEEFVEAKKNAETGGGGVMGTNLPQTSAEPIQLQCEVWRSNNEKSSHMIMGRSMGEGVIQGQHSMDDKAGEIRLICGPAPEKPFKYPDGSMASFRPKASCDAASLTISQKTLPNRLGGITLSGTPGATADGKPCSTVRAVADSIILVGDEYIKLVTKTKARNSQLGNIQQNGRIELIANNNAKSLQPMVRGEYMVDAFYDLYSKVHATNAMLEAFILHQNKLNKATTSHFHITQWHATPSLICDPLWESGVEAGLNICEGPARSIFNNRINLDSSWRNFFMKGGSKPVLSELCFLT